MDMDALKIVTAFLPAVMWILVRILIAQMEMCPLSGTGGTHF